MKAEGHFKNLQTRILRLNLTRACVLILFGVYMNAFSLFAGTKLPTSGKGTAKSVIEIWLWGGPSQMETFDPKPDAGPEYNGGFKAIPTNVEGIMISEFLPKLAMQADKYSLIRSMTHGINAHETATYIMQTGRQPGEKVFPVVGAIIGMMKGYDYGYVGKIPPYVVLTTSNGRVSEIGFLNPKYKPLVTGGDPNAQIFAVDGIVNKNLDREAQNKNRELLNSLDSFPDSVTGMKEIAKFDGSGDEAYELITGAAGSVFNLSKEDNATRELYGRNSFGQACLVARRLVQSGVPYITINFDGFDTHKRHFQAIRQKSQQLDQGLAALLQDLSDKGLLDTTIVWCAGEFGREPKISTESPWNIGRQHYGKCFSALVAGGGFKGGKVVGASDAKAEKPFERPVYPQDLIGSILELSGINPDDDLPNPMGETIKIMPAQSEFGRLKEIYERR